MIRCAVITPWAADGGGVYYPQLLDHYACGFEDVTGQQSIPPDPNVYTVIATMTVGMFSALSEDSRYYVLWSEEVA